MTGSRKYISDFVNISLLWMMEFFLGVNFTK